MKEQDLRRIIRNEIRSTLDETVSAALNTRMDRVDKTQAMQMLQKALQSKPATQQAEFVADLVKKLNLKGNIGLLIKKIRKVN
jgi:transcription initiation factor TFIIIB Brf1 subunit/transcription initiation factor TFIIB